MSKPHLLLEFDAALMSFGGVAVDNYGKTDPFPSASLLTGLIANALGYDRSEAEKLQAVQDHLVYAVRIDVPGAPLSDFQTAELAANAKGWTTRGAPEGRTGGADTYKGKHIRYRDYWANRIVHVALRLEPADVAPTLENVANALKYPARPLFIGRKPCLPSGSLLAGTVYAPNVLAALESVDGPSQCEAFWPEREHDGRPHTEPFTTTGQRNWRSGVHGGWERWRRGTIASRSVS